MTNPNILSKPQAIVALKAILGENYITNWDQPDLLGLLTKIANDLIHFKTDSQACREKSQQLEQGIQANISLNQAYHLELEEEKK